MLKLMNDLPESVLGVSAEGKITGTDYETVLIPALELKLKTNKKIQMIYHLGNSFTAFDVYAMLDDAKMGLKHLSAFDKVALVSDHRVINNVAKFFGYLLSCELRIYKDAELEDAKKWISEK
jgi:hypothetical protein